MKWWKPAAAAVLVVAVAGVVTVQYRDRVDALAHERRVLAHDQQVAAARQRSLDGVRAAAAASLATTASLDTQAARARDDTTKFDGQQRATWKQASDLVTLLQRTEATSALLARSATTVRACLDSQSRAAAAIQVHDNAGAALALNDGRRPCAVAIAAATGARYPYDFPDPFVLAVAGGYDAFATNSTGGTVQVLHSRDLSSWTAVGDAFGALPAWAAGGGTWAPSVLHFDVPVSYYMLYVTVREAATGLACVTRAIAGAPAGPYADSSTGPLVCDHGDGGSIDPEAFRDEQGTPWLLWKRESAGARLATIVVQQLSPDGLTLIGPQFDLLAADRPWEHGVVEGPSMLHSGDKWYLFFSAGSWSTRNYSEGVAVCDAPIGPCHAPTQLLASHDHVAGPGGGSVFVTSTGAIEMAYHAYTEPFVGWPASRTLRFARVHVDPTGVALADQ